MRRIIPSILAAAILVALPAAASAHRDHYEKCATTSDYAVRLDRGEAVFSRSGGHEIRFDAGRLVVDGREVALSAADRARVADYERTLETIVPEVRAIAIEAVGIAFTAIGQVARTFLDADAEAAIARLADKQAKTVARIEETFAGRSFDDAAFEAVVEETVAEVIPEVAALAAGAAVRAVLAGEAAAGDLKRRADALEAIIEREVEARAKHLEQRAEALCGRLGTLDAIESELTVQIDGEPLDLIRMR